jgi:hypothetical protein
VQRLGARHAKARLSFLMLPSVVKIRAKQAQTAKEHLFSASEN